MPKLISADIVLMGIASIHAKVCTCWELSLSNSCQPEVQKAPHVLKQAALMGATPLPYFSFIGLV